MNEEMTKEEAARALLARALTLLEIDRMMGDPDPDLPELIALLRGAKELLRSGIHKRRNHASRVHRGRPLFCQSSAKPGADCQGLANPPQAACHEKSGSPSPTGEGRSRFSSLDQRMLGKERAEDLSDAECQSSAKPAESCQSLANPAEV